MKVSIELNMVARRKRMRVGVIEMDVSLKSMEQLVNETGVRMTGREVQVRDLILLGLANKEIANKLHISARTVKFHASKLYVKYGVDGRAALVYLLTHLKQVIEEVA